MKRYLVSFLVVLFAAGCGQGKSWHKSTFIFFDTVCELRVFCSSAEFSEAKKEVEDIFSTIEENFAPGRRSTGSELVEYLLAESFKINKNTGGCFDITVGPLKEAWGFLDGRHRIPSREEITELMKVVGMDKIPVVNGEITVPDLFKLDWGGIAKGYGVELAARALLDMNIKRGFLNAGGDLFCWGKNPDKRDWRIGIQHPRQSGYIGVLTISGLAAATSGDYQRFFMKDGIRYSHIFDPSTGYPARGKQSVTVIGPRVFLCDALSTAVFVSEEPEKIFEKYPEYGAVVVDDNGEITFLGKKFPVELLN